jgi:hypothetical protein
MSIDMQEVISIIISKTITDLIKSLLQMGGISNLELFNDKKIVNIKTQKTIYKISNSVFSYNKINYDNNYINSICNLLDLGIKFVPNLIDNIVSYNSNLFKEIDNSLLEFNRQVFYKNINEKENNLNKNNKSNDILNTLRNKRTINYDTIPIQNETLKLRFNLLKNLIENKPALNTNISNSNLNNLKHFIKNKPFVILQCDKNVGTMLISHEDMIDLANQHLNDNKTYKKTSSNEFEILFNKINTILNQLHSKGDISNEMKDKLILDDINNFNAGKFRILAKVHKKEFGIRPIINCKNHITSKLCRLIHIMINPLIQSIKHILRDSQQLLQELENVKFKDNQILYSCDFESLYTNIKPDHAIDIISIYLINKTNILNQFNITITGFRVILNLIFSCNLFKFYNNYYIQLVGIPMGCVCGPSIANLFIFILEEKWLNLNPDIMYYRFIDDIWMAADKQLDLVEFKSYFDYLKLNIESAESVNFLDLEIFFDKITKKMNFSLYIKPTNSFSYLLPSSNHPKHIFDNIIISLVIRIRRICTKTVDYFSHTRNLCLQLVKRGYNFNKINGIIRNVGNIERKKLLPYKPKDNNFLNNNSLKIFIKYDDNNYLLKNFLYHCYYKLKNEFEVIKENKLLIINKINDNIGSMLIHNKKLEKNCKYSYLKCKDNDCTICIYADKFYYFKYDKFILPLKSLSSCDSEGIIYIINCNICNCFYIGESIRSVKDRISEHIRNIKKFKKNIIRSLINNNSEVAEHFNLKNHSLDNFKFIIFEKGVINNEIRKSIETDLINIFKLCKIRLLNNIIKQPNIFNIKYLTFQT